MSLPRFCFSTLPEMRLLKLRHSLLALALLSSACSKDRAHLVRVSIAEQRMAVYEKGTEVARYGVSTSKFGIGDIPGSNRTPVGQLEVAQKIGDGAPLGMKFKDRKPTGEIVAVNAPGRDPIVTRILWLRGLESDNANAFERMIYIHGTPEEARIGATASYGCIRMRSSDVVALFNTIGEGARVVITPDPLPQQSLPTRSKPAAQNTNVAKAE